MTTTYPGTVDALARPGSATYTDDSGYELDLVLDSISDAIEATQTELGATPSSNVQMTHVRLGNNSGRGLYVPLSAVAGPSLVLNPNFDIFQRGSGSRTATTSFSIDTSFAADRIYVLPAGASVAVARSTTVPSNNRSRYSLEITGATSVTTVDIGQRIKSSIVNTRGKQSLCFIAYVYNGSGGAFTPNLRVGTPGAADDFTTVTNRLDQSLQSCADASWTLVYHVFDPSAYTNIANGMQVDLRIPSGSLVSGDTVRVAQFDLRPATQPIGFVPPDPDEELSRCEPYFVKSFPLATAPAQNTGSVLGAMHVRTVVASADEVGVVRFGRRMVKAPTITTYNPSASNANWRDLTNSADRTAATAAVGETGFIITLAVGAINANNYIHYVANAELT